MTDTSPGNRCYAQAPGGGLCQLDNGHAGLHGTRASHISYGLATTPPCDAPGPRGQTCRLAAGHSGSHGDNHDYTWSGDELYGVAATCGDHYIDDHGTLFTCTREQDHDGMHAGPHPHDNGTEQWPHNNCGVITRTESRELLGCCRDADHTGPHVAVPSPGERYTWTTYTEPEPCGAQRTGAYGRIYTCGSPLGHAGSHIDRDRTYSWSRNAEPIAPDPVWHDQLDAAVDRHNMHAGIINRDRAIEHAIQALLHVAGAYHLPAMFDSGKSGYGDAIITLAEQLHDYIQNGTHT